MKPYGCNNSTRAQSYIVPIRIVVGETLAYGTQKIIDHSSTDCRYDNRNNDQRCKGCKK